MIKLKSVLSFCLCLCLAWTLILLPAAAHAATINNIRGFANQDKTRVVLDLDFNPTYSTALNDNGRTFVVRVKNVDNYRTAPAVISVQEGSAVVGLSKALDQKDVRYIFSLQGSGTPNVFVLKPQDGHNYRLVMDFPHTGTTLKSSGSLQVLSQATAEARRGTGRGSGGIPPTHVITVQDADDAEKALLNSLSQVGSDGIRTMTPQQAQAYEQKIREIRQRQQQTAAAQKTNPAPVSGRTQTTAQKATAKNTAKPKVEEEVLDTQAPPVPQVIQAVPDPFIIAVDAGHGGKDPGATGKRGVREKNVTLAIAQSLASYINSNKQFRAVLIRNSDVFVDLDRRSEIARQKKADILISIHADSVASGNSARGASVWVLSNNRAERENKKILNGDGSSKDKLLGGAGDVLSQSEQNPYLAATILDMSSDNSRSDGYLLGQEILSKLGGFTKLHNKKPIHASLAVLKSPDIPSLLIETGFLSNQYEEIQLNQPNYQKQIAYCIYQGIASYYEKYPKQRFKSRQESAQRVINHEKVHTVKKGEYLAKIARDYHVTVAALKKRNSLSSDTLKIGQRLIIP